MLGLNNSDIENKYLYAIELLLWSSTNGSEIKYDYCTYYYSQCKIHDPRKLHIWLYQNGYLRNATVEEVLLLNSTTDLKEIAAKYQCKKSGTKQDIAQRITLAMPDTDKIETINSCDKLFLTQKGLDFYTQNYDLVKLHLAGGIAFNEYLHFRKSSNYENNAIELYEFKLEQYISQKNYSGMSICYQKLHELYGSINEPDLAMQYILFRLFLSANCCDSFTFLFNPASINTHGVPYMKKQIVNNSSFLLPYDCKEVNAYSAYYCESMIDNIFNQNLLPYSLIDKNTFTIIVNDIITNISIDRDYYISIIANNYEKLVKHQPLQNSQHKRLIDRIFKRG